ncbi:hypothetical protein [Sulfitobacter delicatus]|uniref:Tyr recombinase domain-containing protein n=1 Tax=Sulfitobacter delicatus TaxID=218672 RepID=A0A1G7TRE2_9RHOB|nr:hypothetical protein [Sulfitobacter delicatus]SDG37838.1 hypothetical protein SAMN04489759_10736 [Sulfitobacter delicatus]
MNEHLALLARIRSAGPGSSPPGQDDLKRHLSGRLQQIGAPALMEFAHVQKVAAEVWGAERCAHFANVLREARVAPKSPRRTSWQMAKMRLSDLPDQWQANFAERIEASEAGVRKKGQVLWSAAHTQNVIRALRGWVAYCRARDLPMSPTGETLDGYAREVAKKASVRTASDYINRILTGIKLVMPGFSSQACEFVACDWRERAAKAGSTTKTGAQLVGASRVYNLGFDLMQQARSRRLRGLHAAKDFRNGILLSVAVALPQRARALSALEFGRTLRIPGEGMVHIHLPARMLKLPEDQKAGAPFDRTLSSQKLASALEEYRYYYRPMFDDGASLFPSMHARGAAISEAQIGRLTGDLTERALGVRISVHRLRDNVATEASEHLASGARAATALLGQRDEQTAQRHYDHSTGLASAQEFVDMIERQRSFEVEFDL